MENLKINNIIELEVITLSDETFQIECTIDRMAEIYNELIVLKSMHIESEYETLDHKVISSCSYADGVAIFYMNTIDVSQIEKEAYENSLSAIFDGLKYIADANNPFELVTPMKIYANQFYNYNDTKYVCIETGIFDGTEIEKYLVEADL